MTEITLTGADLGLVLGVSERRVRELRDQGVLVSDAKGQYPCTNIAAYCSHIRPASGKGAGGGSDAGSSLDDARVRLVTAQAQARELLNAQLRGDAVLAEDVEAIVGATFDAIRNKMLAVPITAAARVFGLTDQAAIREQISSLIDNALMDLANAEVVRATKERARRRAGRGEGDAEQEEGASE